MQAYRCAGIIIISFALFLCYTDAGPVRSIALANVQRGSKIPRSIRAPFRNTEIMTARGFGKRATFNAWNNGKHETKYFDDVLNNDVNENFEEIFNEQGSERYMFIPIDWLVGELLSNPGLIRAILYRFVDLNKDGLLSTHELMQSTSLPSSSLSSSDVY